MTVQNTYYTFKTLFVVLSLSSVALFGFFCYETYLLVEQNRLFFSEMQDFHFAERNLAAFVHLFIEWVSIGAKYLAAYIGVKIMVYLAKRIVVPARWVNEWQKSGQIKTIFGRRLVKYYRVNRILLSQSFCNMYEDSQEQISMVAHHASTDKLSALFRAHDVFWRRDNPERLQIEDESSPD